jgi:hypothetical protein
MLNVFVAEIVLQGSGIDALIGQLEAAGMTQHLRVNLKWHLRRCTEPCNHSPETNGTYRRTPLRHEHLAPRLLLFALKAAQGA